MSGIQNADTWRKSVRASDAESLGTIDRASRLVDALWNIPIHGCVDGWKPLQSEQRFGREYQSTRDSGQSSYSWETY